MSKRRIITAAMREGIRQGRWKPGEQLPTVAQVCEEFKASTATAVYAMLDLGAAVDARQGSGYFVAENALAVLDDKRPAAVAETHAALLALRDDLDRVIASLAA